MEVKKFRSIVRRVVLLPMSVMAVIVCITIISCVIGFFNMRQQMVDSSLSSLQVSQNQLENLLNQIDHAFIQYWNVGRQIEGDANIRLFFQLLSN